MNREDISIVVILLILMSISFLYSCSVVIEDDVVFSQENMLPNMDSFGN